MIVSAKEYLDGFSDRETIDMNNPSCNNCDECCCCTASITEDEFRFFLKFFSKNKEGKRIFKEAKAKYDERFKTGALNLKCYFLTKNKKCRIYKIRPQICRDFHCKPSLMLKRYTEEELQTGYTIRSLFVEEGCD